MALNTFRYKDYAYSPKHNLEELLILIIIYSKDMI